jgi:hypothetical protein
MKPVSEAAGDELRIAHNLAKETQGGFDAGDMILIE